MGASGAAPLSALGCRRGRLDPEGSAGPADVDPDPDLVGPARRRRHGRHGRRRVCCPANGVASPNRHVRTREVISLLCEPGRLARLSIRAVVVDRRHDDRFHCQLRDAELRWLDRFLSDGLERLDRRKARRRRVRHRARGEAGRRPTVAAGSTAETSGVAARGGAFGRRHGRDRLHRRHLVLSRTVRTTATMTTAAVAAATSGHTCSERRSPIRAITRARNSGDGSPVVASAATRSIASSIAERSEGRFTSVLVTVQLVRPEPAR